MTEIDSPPVNFAPESSVPVDGDATKKMSNSSSKSEIAQKKPTNFRDEFTKSDNSPSASPSEKASDDPPSSIEPASRGLPLPQKSVTSQHQEEDDGWDCQWEPNAHAWYFLNRFTGKSQWENPRVARAPDATTQSSSTTTPLPSSSERLSAGGYNPAIHGDYDPNAWYAQGATEEVEDEPEDPAIQSTALDPYVATARFNRFTGQFQDESTGPGRHSDEAKARRQMNAFFDLDASANSHDGRSLKAERSNKKPSKSEVKAFKEKRKARKEEKRRAWLRD